MRKPIPSVGIGTLPDEWGHARIGESLRLIMTVPFPNKSLHLGWVGFVIVALVRPRPPAGHPDSAQASGPSHTARDRVRDLKGGRTATVHYNSL